MGNHGILVIGNTVAEAFNRMFYFERAAETYIKALWTGQPLRMLSDEIAEKTAAELDNYPGQAERHLSELKAILDDAGAGLPELSASKQPEQPSSHPRPCRPPANLRVPPSAAPARRSSASRRQALPARR